MAKTLKTKKICILEKDRTRIAERPKMKCYLLFHKFRIITEIKSPEDCRRLKTRNLCSSEV